MAISDEERKRRLQRAQSIQANALNGKASGNERKQRLQEATEIQNKVLQEHNAKKLIKQQQEQEQRDNAKNALETASKAAVLAGTKTLEAQSKENTIQSLARKAAENQAFRNYNKDGFTMRESTGILNREDEKRIGKDTVAKVQNSPEMRFASQKVAEQTAKRDLEKLGVDNKETEKKISEIYRKNAETAFDLKAKQSVTKSTQDIKDMSIDELKSFIPNGKEEAQAYINTVDQMSNHNVELSANKKMYVFAADKAIKAGAELSDEQKEKYVKFKDDENLDLLSAGKPKYGTFTSKMDNEYFKNLSLADKLDKVMRDTGDTATAVGSALVSGATGLFTELVGYVGDGFDKVMEGINWAGDKLSNDLLGFNTDFFKKNKEFWENAGSGEEWHKATEDMHNQAVANNMNLGMSREAAEMLASLEEAVGQAIPQVAMAVATGGSSEALYAAKSMANAKRAMNLTNAAAKGSKLARVGQSLKTIATDVAAQYKAWAKQPMFTTTLITELGSNYDDAVEQGADPKTASAWAIFASLVNSAIEMGGGIEAGPSSVLREALEEGAEEIYQGTVSGLMKVATVPDIPLVSIDGSNAAFNLKELALSFVGGALGGATGGGIGKLIDFSANPITTAQKRKALGNAMKSDENTLAAYIDMGMKSGNDKIMSEATSIFNALDRGKLDSIASVTLGKFAQKTERAYQLAVINKIANAEKSDDTKANIKTASKIYTAIGQIINNPEYYLSDTLATHIKHNPVAGEILTKSAGLQSRINEYTPVSTIREVARMVSSNISNGVRDNSNISIDQVGRPVNTNSPREIDEGAIERVRNKTAKLDDYLSVTGKSLDSYLKDDGSYSADKIIAEANSVITELDRIKAENPVKASEPAAHDSIITGNASTGMDVVNPQNVVTVKDNSITLDNGVTVPVTDELLSQNDSRLSDTTKKLYSASAGYKDNVKAAFISGYNGVDVDTYIKQFQNVYDVFELTGKLSEDERYDAVKYIEQALGKEVFNVARKAGQQARHEREQARMRQNERQKANRENDKGKNKTAQRASETAKTGYALAKKYSIKYTTENKPVVVIEDNILDGVSKNDWVKTVKNVISEKFSGGIPISGRLIKVNIKTRKEYTNSKNTIHYKERERQIYADKFKSANNLDEIVLASTNYVNEDLKHNRNDNFKEFARGDVLIRVGSNDYTANVIVGFTTSSEMVLYDVIGFKPTTLKIKKVGAHTAQSQEVKSSRSATPTNNTIPQNDTVVNSNIRKNYENSDTTQRKKGVTIKKYKTTIRNSNGNGKIGAFTDGKTQADIIEKIAKEYNKRGINVEIIDEAGEQNGWYTPSSNTITVNLSAKNPLEAFLHETGHAIKAYAGEYWEEIKNAAFTYIAQIEDESISELRKGYAELFEAHSRSYTNEAIDEEIVSDAIAAMARDKNSVLKFYNALIQNGAEETLAQKIIRKLKEILMKLKAHFLDFDTIAVEYNSSVTRAVREGNTSKTPFFEYADKISNILSQSFENLQVTETEGDAKCSIKYDVNNRPYVVIEEDILKGVARKDVRKKVSTIIRDKFSPGIQVGNNYIKINAKSRNEFVNSKATQAYFERNKQIFANKMNSANNLDEIIWASRDYVEEAPSHKRTDNFDSFGRGQVQISIDNKEYVADIIIGHTTNNEMIFYDVINIRPTNIKKRRASYKVEPKRPTLASGHSASSNNTISQNDTVVNSNISKNSENDTKKFSLKQDIDNKYGSLYNEEKPLTVSKQTFRRIEAAMNERLARAFSGGAELPPDYLIYLSDRLYKVKIHEYGTYSVIGKYNSLEDYERKRGLKNVLSNYETGIQDNSDFERDWGTGRSNRKYIDNIANGRTAERNVEVDRRASIRKSDENGSDRHSDKGNGDSNLSERGKQQINSKDSTDPFRKYSLLEDIDIRLAKKAYQRNKKLQVDTQVVKDLFEKAGRVLDKSTVDAVADKIAKRYYFGGDAKMKQLLRDKLYAFYTYVSREDAVDAQIALYSYEVAKDIVAMSKEVSGFTDGENVYEEYGESIYDIIAADLINEYSNTAIVQAPQRLQEEHEKIAEKYRNAEPDSAEKEALLEELKASRDELVAARERYVRSLEEVKKLDSLLKRTQAYYKRKLDNKRASREAKSLVYSLRPEQKRIRNKEIMKLVDKYGAYPQNPNSKVDAYVPKRDSRGLAVSRVPKTIIESDFADENTINTINDAILDGALSHEIKSNKSAQEYAESAMEEGFDKAYFEFKKEIEKIKTFADDTPNKVALAKELIEEAQRRGDQDTVRDIVTDLAIYGLLGGRTTQAFNMLRATGSAGQALYLEKWVQRRNKELRSKWRDKRSTWAKEDNPLVPRNVQGYKTGYNEFKPLVLNKALMQRLVNVTDEEEITELSTKIMADLALQENSTLADKIQAWRYMSMLTNPTTHIRNLVGNGIFAILREGQNTVRVGLEKALNKASGGKIKLTTVVKIKDEYKKFAKEDWKKSNSLARKSGKYNIDDFIMQEKKIFKSKVGKPIEKVRKFNSGLLEAEDGIFIKYAYTRALGRYLQAQKISLEENSDPKLEQERQSRIEEARAYALEESLIATYRNANAVATALTQLANKNAAFDILVNSVMPFKKTPANIFVQSMKYSPIGIGLGIKQIVFEGKKQKMTANQIIDTFASGITGTGVFLLGLLLRRLGILQGMFDDDDGDDQIDKMKKIQENSINIFGQSFTIDWSAPAIVPLMMGAEFSDGIGNFEFDGSLTDNIWQIVSRSVDPLINMTMLEGLNDMLTSIKYSENNSIGELGFRAISNYASQFIPTVGGKIARTLDGTSRMTYIDPDDNDFLSRNIQNVQKKSPFWYSSLQPVVDEWGREDKEGNVITRILENFISPGYWETIDSDDATDVIEDLYDELQDKSLLPKKPEKSFTMYVEYFDGEKYESVKDKENYKNGKREMSGDEYTTAALAQGQTQHDLIAELKENSVYESMNGAEKAAVIENIYKFAKYAGKYAVDDSYYGSEQEKWCRELNNNRASLTGILNEILNRSREK